jgi:hypothetical protein
MSPPRGPLADRWLCRARSANTRFVPLSMGPAHPSSRRLPASSRIAHCETRTAKHAPRNTRNTRNTRNARKGSSYIPSTGVLHLPPSRRRQPRGPPRSDSPPRSPHRSGEDKYLSRPPGIPPSGCVFNAPSFFLSFIKSRRLLARHPLAGRDLAMTEEKILSVALTACVRIRA